MSLPLSNRRNFDQPFALLAERSIGEPVDPESWVDVPLSDIPIGGKVFAIVSDESSELFLFKSQNPAIVSDKKENWVEIKLPDNSIQYFKNNSISKNPFKTSSILITQDQNSANTHKKNIHTMDEQVKKILSNSLVAVKPFDLYSNISPPRFSTINNDTRKISLKTIAKTAALFLCAVSAFFFIDDLARMHLKNSFDEKIANLKNVTKVPCKPNVTAYQVEYIGNCSYEEKMRALEERERLRIELEKAVTKQLKEETTRDLDVFHTKHDKEVALILEDFQANERMRKERERRFHNPTPEEREADLRAHYKKIARESPFMEDYYRAQFPQYFDALPPAAIICDQKYQTLSRKILQVGANANCAEIKKQFHALSLKAHPDKNSNGEESRYLAITEAYERLCS